MTRMENWMNVTSNDAPYCIGDEALANSPFSISAQALVGYLTTWCHPTFATTHNSGVLESLCFDGRCSCCWASCYWRMDRENAMLLSASLSSVGSDPTCDLPSPLFHSAPHLLLSMSSDYRFSHQPLPTESTQYPPCFCFWSIFLFKTFYHVTSSSSSFKKKCIQLIRWRHSMQSIYRCFLCSWTQLLFFISFVFLHVFFTMTVVLCSLVIHGLDT